jgi:hypothetical protein
LWPPVAAATGFFLKLREDRDQALVGCFVGLLPLGDIDDS